MLSIITHRFLFFKKKEIWFYNSENIREEGYTSYCYSLCDLQLKYDSCLKEFTTIIDLKKSEAEIFSSISKTFRYHIRKAEYLNYTHNFNPTKEDCRRLIREFNKFAAFKNLARINKKRIMALQQCGNLLISKALDGQTEIVSHVYLFDMERTVLLHTFHNPENDHPHRGYANKCLHWKDIMIFKNNGLAAYDLGGIELQKVPGISNFKLNFGGGILQVNSYVRIAGALKIFFYLYKKIQS